MAEEARPTRLSAAVGWLARRPGHGQDSVAVESLISAHRAHHPKADEPLLRRAYETADWLHENQTRKSGHPYIVHPLAVALILAELGADSPTLAAALLHDTVEDTPYSIGQLSAEFGEEVAVMVDGVTKLDGSRWGERAEAETYRKMILAAAADMRVLVIKLADRLHNLRTLSFQPRHKQERTARQSVELLIPFAARLGIYRLKREMDDLCFAVLQPEAHAAIAAAAEEAARPYRERFARLEDAVRAELAAAKLKGDVVVHRRHLWAVHLDLRGRVDPVRPGDLFRLLVILDAGPTECYLALGAVHRALRPVPGRMKDFVALPRFNLYRSIHTQVVTPEFDVVDVMIRTREMHRLAEVGIVAYLVDPAGAASAAGRRDLEWLRRLLNWQDDATSDDFLENLRVDLLQGSIVVFGSNGQAITLPDGATAVDFAYAIDGEMGASAIGALVNGKLTPLSTPLANGHVVEILTEPEGTPSVSWLEFARTPTARLQIRRWLENNQTEIAAERGRRDLADVLSGNGVDLIDLEAGGVAGAVCRQLGYRDLDHMYAAVAAQRLVPADLAERMLKPD